MEKSDVLPLSNAPVRAKPVFFDHTFPFGPALTTAANPLCVGRCATGETGRNGARPHGAHLPQGTQTRLESRWANSQLTVIVSARSRSAKGTPNKCQRGGGLRKSEYLELRWVFPGTSAKTPEMGREERTSLRLRCSQTQCALLFPAETEGFRC